MKKLSLYYAAFVMCTFTACADQKSVTIEPEQIPEQKNVTRENTDALPLDFSMLDIGRALSDGTVDIYDPWLTVFLVTPPERTILDPSVSFPVHPFMLVRDEEVRVYSLNSNEMSPPSFSNVLNEVADLPVSLIEQEPLLP